MTAGHCMDALVANPPSVWKTYDGSNHQINIGDPARFKNKPIDAGAIRVDPSSVFAQGPTPAEILVHRNGFIPPTEHYEIYRVPPADKSLVGRRICWTSGRPLNQDQRYTRCAKVSQVHDHQGGYNFYIQVDACNPKGSSGSPLFKSHRAYGILSQGRTQSRLFRPCRSWFTEARIAENALDVEIKHTR